MLKAAYNAGMRAALVRYKVALPVSGGAMGADYGVAPSGSEVSHGTDRTTYAPGKNDNPSTRDPDYNDKSKEYGSPDFLWNISEYNRLSPGYTGEWGQEVIG